MTEPKHSERGHHAPQVVFWFRVYATVLCGIFFLGTILGGAFFVLDPPVLDLASDQVRLLGSVLLLLSGGLFVVFLVPLVSRPRPRVWSYGLVLICLGLASPCTLPACIPLLMFWLKPAAKAYFEV